MSEDFKLIPNIGRKDIQFQVQNHINDILHSMGADINEYKLVQETIRPSKTAKEAKEVHFERTIIVSEEDTLLYKKLNKDQFKEYNTIMERIFSHRVGAFFINGPRGIGKTFLYCALLAIIQSKGYIALATTTSGVAASILPGGRTAHSRFKISINVDDTFSCNISKQNMLAVVVSCGGVKFAGIHGNKCRQIVIMDTNMRHCIFTLWEDFAEIDGSELAAQIENHPVILAKTNCTIFICWDISDNKIQFYNIDKSCVPTSYKTDKLMQSFHIEGKILFLNDEEQIFYELIYAKCKNIVRTKIIKGSECGNCQEHTMLTPRYNELLMINCVLLLCDMMLCVPIEFQPTDGSGLTAATLLGELRENLLSMRAEQIYETINIKKDPLPFQCIEQDLYNKVFKIQLRKSYSRNSDDAPAKLFVSSFVEKQDALQLPTSSTSLDVGESGKRELDNASSADEPKKPTIGSTSSSKRQQLECTTP
ncbi:hypothetical protein BC332_15786 [Capsicum chinense]|nr:hypothetical protein BC332_15786 [Capsicum chinense]